MSGFEKDRARLLEEIESEAKETEHWTGRAAFSDRVMASLATVPRHRFVTAGDEAQAYSNRPRGIGFGQTISQPYIVAVMTDLLDLGTGDRVLEIGTGSGYQTAVLAPLVSQVFSIECVPELARGARRLLAELGYENIEIRNADGNLGWPEESPFDAIMVTAAAAEIPAPLIAQLTPGGRMIIPIGPPGGHQTLYVGRKDAAGEFVAKPGLPVAFVTLVGGGG